MIGHHFLATTFDFTTFFLLDFLEGRTPFHSLAVLEITLRKSRGIRVEVKVVMPSPKAPSLDMLPKKISYIGGSLGL